jgi:CRISPR-associated protein Csx17
MNIHSKPLTVIRLAGLHLDTLGHYLAALGLLRLSARKWPAVKCCWRGGIFCLIGGPKNFTELEVFLLDIGANDKWTPYFQSWSEHQKKDTKNKTAHNFGLWRANDTNEIDAVIAFSHIATAERLSFNPVFGTGGNAGKRNFSKGWQRAKRAVEAKDSASKFKRNKKKEDSPTAYSLFPVTEEPAKEIPVAARYDLSAFLTGKTCSFLADFGAACWFSEANKIYNFRPDKPFCEGQLTPWAMLFACEAFPLIVGSTSRQIGSQRQGTGAFPFVTKGAAPVNEKETGTVEGEFWAPIWENPFSLSEVSLLFKRGRAEVDGRGAITSAAFAAAILQKGIDAGLKEFRRFSLLHTTSAQTFESRLASVHMLGTFVDTAQAEAITRIIRFRDALPPEEKKGTKWKYRGLQGPIDNALIRLAAVETNNEQRVESSWQLLDTIFSSMEKTANNKTYREREPSLSLLPVSWAVSLLKNTLEITPEARIALALSTLHCPPPQNAYSARNKNDRLAPLLAYRIGVEPAWKNNWHTIKIAKDAPLRVVWSQRGLTESLCAVIRRRVVVESEAGSAPPFNARLTLSLADTLAFLGHEVDDSLTNRWLTRFMLFDWSNISPKEYSRLREILTNTPSSNPLLPEELLYSFFRPLFHAYTFLQLEHGKTSNIRPQPTAKALRQLVALLERGDCSAAYQAAANQYKSLLQPISHFGRNCFNAPKPGRLLAALLLPASPKMIAKTFTRWRLPEMEQQN